MSEQEQPAPKKMLRKREALLAGMGLFFTAAGFGIREMHRDNVLREDLYRSGAIDIALPLKGTMTPVDQMSDDELSTVVLDDRNDWSRGSSGMKKPVQVRLSTKDGTTCWMNVDSMFLNGFVGALRTMPPERLQALQQERDPQALKAELADICNVSVDALEKGVTMQETPPLQPPSGGIPAQDISVERIVQGIQQR